MGPVYVSYEKKMPGVLIHMCEEVFETPGLRMVQHLRTVLDNMKKVVNVFNKLLSSPLVDNFSFLDAHIHIPCFQELLLGCTCSSSASSGLEQKDGMGMR